MATATDAERAIHAGRRALALTVNRLKGNLTRATARREEMLSPLYVGGNEATAGWVNGKNWHANAAAIAKYTTNLKNTEVDLALFDYNHPKETNMRAPELHPNLLGTSYESEVRYLLHRLRADIAQLQETIRLFELPHKGRLRAPEHGDKHNQEADALRAAQRGDYHDAKNLIVNYAVRVP